MHTKGRHTRSSHSPQHMYCLIPPLDPPHTHFSKPIYRRCAGSWACRILVRAGEAARVTHHQPPSDLIQWSSHRDSTNPSHALARGSMLLAPLAAPRASPAASPTSPGALLPSLILPWFELIPCGLASHVVGPGRNVSDMYIDVLKHSPVASSPLMHT